MRHRGASFLVGNVLAAAVVAIAVPASLGACLPTSRLATPNLTPPGAQLTPGPEVTQRAEGELEFLELVVFPGADALTWHAAGLARNAGAAVLADTAVEVAFRTSTGSVLGSSIVPLALSYLPLGESSPFLAHLTADSAPSGAEARLDSYLPVETEWPVVGVLAPATTVFRAADGRLVLLMRIENPHDQPIRVGEVAAILRDEAGHLAGAAEGVAGVTGIGPGGQTTWLLMGEATVNASPALAFTDAGLLPSLPDPKLRLVAPLALPATDQGQGFALGEIINEGETLRWARGVVTIQIDGEVTTVALLAPPMPLRPAERLAFALTDFPGLTPLPANATASLEIDPLASEPAEGNVTPLSLEITHLEQIGSSVFARGRIENRTGGDVLRPSVLAAVHATDGRLLSAGWATPLERLPSSATVEFRFQIPLPAGFDIESAEFDWRALGVAPK
ncbi:MAG: hypothetical protein ACRDG5_08535 [Anaerolineales bacterium]